MLNTPTFNSEDRVLADCHKWEFGAKRKYDKIPGRVVKVLNIRSGVSGPVVTVQWHDGNVSIHTPQELTCVERYEE